MPTGILKAKTAMPRDSTREMIEHQVGGDLEDAHEDEEHDERKKSDDGCQGRHSPATAVVDGVKDWANKRGSHGCSARQCVGHWTQLS